MTTAETPPSWINKGKNEIAAWIRPKMVGARAAAIRDALLMAYEEVPAGEVPA